MINRNLSIDPKSKIHLSRDRKSRITRINVPHCSCDSNSNRSLIGFCTSFRHFNRCFFRINGMFFNNFCRNSLHNFRLIGIGYESSWKDSRSSFRIGNQRCYLSRSSRFHRGNSHLLLDQKFSQRMIMFTSYLFLIFFRHHDILKDKSLSS